MRTTVFGSLLITYAVVQTLLLLLLLRFVDLYEREPASMIALMALWGAVGATTISSVGNQAVQDLLPTRIDEVFGTTISAPVVEEIAKGLVLVAFLWVSISARGRFGIPRFEGVTDGIVYGAAVGLGFSFTEDILFLLLGATEGGLESGLVSFLARRDFFGLSGLRHAIYSASFGVGLGLMTWSRSKRLRFVWPVLGLTMAILLHAINNGLVRVVLSLRYGLTETFEYVSGIVGERGEEMAATASTVVGVVEGIEVVMVVGFLVLVQLWLRYQRRVIRTELAEEADSGLISRTELALMPSYWRRSLWYVQLIRSGQWERWRLLQRMHNELVDFAFLKHRIKRGAAEPEEVAGRRRLIEKLKAQKLVFL